MRTLLAVILLIGGTAMFGNQDTLTHRAFVIRQKAEGDCIGKAECYGISAAFVLDERWKNAQKYEPELVKTQNVVRVEMSKTSDTGEWVICIVDPDGKRSSFWLKSGSENGGEVRSITTY